MLVRGCQQSIKGLAADPVGARRHDKNAPPVAHHDVCIFNRANGLIIVHIVGIGRDNSDVNQAGTFNFIHLFGQLNSGAMDLCRRTGENTPDLAILAEHHIDELVHPYHSTGFIDILPARQIDAAVMPETQRGKGMIAIDCFQGGDTGHNQFPAARITGIITRVDMADPKNAVVFQQQVVYPHRSPAAGQAQEYLAALVGTIMLFGPVATIQFFAQLLAQFALTARAVGTGRNQQGDIFVAHLAGS